MTVSQNTGATLALPLVTEENLQFVIDQLALAAGKTPEAFIAVSYTNTWTTQAGYDALSYYKDPWGRVHLRGTLDGSGATAVAAGTLPAGYRPSTLLRFPVSYWTGAANALGTCQITSAGVINVYGNADTLTTATSFALSHISFRAV